MKDSTWKHFANIWGHRVSTQNLSGCIDGLPYEEGYFYHPLFLRSSSSRRRQDERHRIVGGALDLATGKDPGGITVNQQCQQHRRMVSRRSAPLVTTHQPAQIQLLDDLHNEPGQMVVRQPLIDGGRQQVLLLAADLDKSAHRGGPCRDLS